MPPKFVKEIIDDWKIEKVLSWLKEVLYLFVIPIRFFKLFYNKEKKEQVSQIIFYTIIAGLVNILLFPDVAIKDSGRLSFSMLLITIPFFVTNSISLLVISRSQLNVWKVISFIYIIFTLFSVPAFTFLNFFISTENYSFYFASNLLFNIASLLSLFLIWHILFDRVVKILLGYLLNIILLNLYLIILSLFLQDTYSHSTVQSADPILNELDENLSKIKTINGYPYSLEVIKFREKNSVFYKLGLMNDTLSFIGKDGIDLYLELSKKNVAFLDTTIPKLKYKRNKEILTSLSEYYTKIPSYFVDPPCDTCLIDDTVYPDGKVGPVVFERKRYKVDEKYTNSLKAYESKVSELTDLNDFANSPNTIFVFFLKPIDYLADLLKLKRKEVDMYIRL